MSWSPCSDPTLGIPTTVDAIETLIVPRAVDLGGLQVRRALPSTRRQMVGPRWIWWNFVSSRKERIERAKEEWRRGRFDTVPGDEAEFIPLPEDNTKPRRALGGVFYP